MTRSYKTREFFNINCQDCKIEFSTNSCRTLRCPVCRKSSEFRSNMLKLDWRLKKLLAAAKNRSKEKKLNFNLDLEYLLDLWNKNTGKCEITKRDLDLTAWGKKGQVNPNAPSIDRIIPELGYTKGNVRLVTYHTNVALSEFGLDELQKLAKDILK